MALNQPLLIPQPWGSDGQVGNIPQDSSEFGKASWAKGFPTETAQPLSEGGIPPNYLDFQGVLNALSAHAFFSQSGAQFAWSNSIDYPVRSIVLGSDNVAYMAIQASGPGYSAGTKNPVNSGTHWARLVDANFLASSDSNVVHRTGAEGINGTKTFSTIIQQASSAPGIAIQNTSITKGTPPSANQITAISFNGNGGYTGAYQLGALTCVQDSTNNHSIYLQSVEPVAGSTTNAKLGVTYPNSGTPYAFAPTTPATASDNEIVTADFLASDDSNVVHKTGNESIEGIKTLTNFLQIQNTAVATETWVSQTNNRYLQYVDKDGVALSAIQFRLTPTANAIRFLARKPKDAETALSGSTLLAAEQDDNGVTRCYCTTPVVNSNTNDIATTAWVINKIASASTSSDATQKDHIEQIPESVLKAWSKVDFKRFKYLDSIAEKGDEEARWHAGVIVQEVIEAFKSEGLDATEWGVVCLQHYDESFHYEDIFDTDENGNKIVVDSIKVIDHEAYDIWGIRYNEALILECAYQRWLGEQREARLAALEARLLKGSE